jgi:aminoglycoside phosphotransferase (APT) family kinase protein
MHPVLTPDQARKLLAPVGRVEIDSISLAATTNHVFRVVTRDHGVFYVKLHTARWYADQADTFFVVNRECAVHALLDKRGMSLPYHAWGDYTRGVLSRSVLICGELPGTSVPDAIARFPDQADAIVGALGDYMGRLHQIEFSTPGLLEPAHAYFCAPEGRVPPVVAWDGGALHHATHLQRDALDVLDRVARRALLPPPTAAALSSLFSSAAKVLKPDYHPPRFTVGNCHAWHFHVAPGEKWTVLGFYDLEAASAGDPTIDLAELEVTLTPRVRSFAWRPPFFQAYGRWPAFEGYKIRLLYYLLCELDKPRSSMIPERSWLADRWVELIEARDWDELAWFPVHS